MIQDILYSQNIDTTDIYRDKIQSPSVYRYNLHDKIIHSKIQ